MASKTYTAQEMRKESNKVTRYDCYVASDMLRQAADMMERESKREKSVEYGIQYRFKPKGFWHTEDTTYASYSGAVVSMVHEKAKCDLIDGAAKYWRIVRREVSGWEEVRDGE